MKKLLVWLLLIAVGAAVQILLPLTGYTLETGFTVALWGGLFVIGIVITALLRTSGRPDTEEARTQKKYYRKYESLPTEECKKAVAERLVQLGEPKSGAETLSPVLYKLLRGNMLSDLSYAEQRQVKNSKSAVAFLHEVGADSSVSHL